MSHSKQNHKQIYLHFRIRCRRIEGYVNRHSQIPQGSVVGWWQRWRWWWRCWQWAADSFYCFHDALIKNNILLYRISIRVFIQMNTYVPLVQILFPSTGRERWEGREREIWCMWQPKSAVRSTSVLPVTHGQGSSAAGEVALPGGFLRLPT